MKKQSVIATGMKALAVLVCFVVVSCSYSNSFASGGSIETAVKFNAVTYEGSKDQSLVFKVDYKNELAQAFKLVIRGEANDVFYSKSFDSKPLTVNIVLKELPENCKLTFEFQSPEKNLSQSFQIDTNVKTVEEYVVKGL